MHPTAYLNKATGTRTARLLAVLALLCVLGLQVVEAAHQHSLDDTSAHCMLCKNPAPTALTSTGHALALLALAAAILVAWASAILAVVHQPRQSRGPPACC